MEYSPNRALSVIGGGDAVTIPGRVSLRGIFAQPPLTQSTSAPYISGEIDFKDGSASGEVLYSVATMGYSAAGGGLWIGAGDGSTMYIEFPGAGILFSNGLYFSPGPAQDIGDQDSGCAITYMTIIYPGGDAS